MNKTTIIIYAVIVGFAILSSVLKKRKKAGAGTQQPNKSFKAGNQSTGTYQQPKQTQPRSLEDILQSLLNEQNPVKTTPREVEETTTYSDNLEEKFKSLEDPVSLESEEKEYYSYDTELEYDEETEDYDRLADHHVHGKGFDEEFEPVEVEERDEWEEIDWRKAVVTAEILKRPEY